MSMCARYDEVLVPRSLRLASFADHLELAVMTQSAAQDLEVFETLVTLRYQFIS